MSGRTVQKKGSIGAAVVWMFVISLLLFWLPLFGPLIAGFVGGKRAGGVGAAVGAVLLPAVLLALMFFALGTALTFMPLIGAVLAAGGFFTALGFISAPLFIGAILGGAMA